MLENRDTEIDFWVAPEIHIAFTLSLKIRSNEGEGRPPPQGNSPSAQTISVKFNVKIVKLPVPSFNKRD